MGGASERSVGQLCGELMTETGTLIRQEMKLATAEVSAKISYAGKQLGWVLAGSCLAVSSLLVLLASLVLGLATLMDAWVAALLVGLITAAAALAIGMRGLTALRSLDPKPVNTIQSLEDTKAWAQEQVR
jgi:hypothetical protein